MIARDEVLLGLAFELIGNCSLLTCSYFDVLYARQASLRHIEGETSGFKAALRTTHSG